MKLKRVLLLLVAAVGCGNALVLDGSADSEIELLKQQVTRLEDKLNGLVENINTECSVKCSPQKSVAFMAQLSADLSNPATGRVVVWDQVQTNIGGAYNVGHGIFTAPVNGTYNFNLVLSSPPSAGSHELHLEVKKNYVEVGYVFLDAHTSYWLRRGTDVTLHLIQGDEVWVEISKVLGTHILAGCCFHSHFSGFLINSD